MEYVSRLFGEAWEHRRRRRRLSVGIALAACAVVALIYAVAGPRSIPTAGLAEPAGTIVLPASAVFAQPPYMGVVCLSSNSIACDRIGLAIWLKRPAYSVRASINGRSLVMNRFGDQLISSTRPRTEFDGYLRPAGIATTLHVRPVPGTSTWLGSPTPVESVWLLIHFASGRHVATNARVPLAAGWG